MSQGVEFKKFSSRNKGILKIRIWLQRPFSKEYNCRLLYLDAEFPSMVTGNPKKNSNSFELNCPISQANLPEMKSIWITALAAFCLVACTRREFLKESGQLDAFAEMVKSGVKPIALSPPMESVELDLFLEEAKRIADKHEIQLYREADLIESDLFSDSLTAGKEVLILYTGDALLAYQALKADIQAAQASGTYVGQKRIELSRRWGRLLGYPVSRINELLAENSGFRDLEDFGIQGSELHWFYKNLQAAKTFYTEKLGLRILSESDTSVVLSVAGDSKLILWDISRTQYTPSTPKSVALAFLTPDLQGWYDHLLAQKVTIKYPLKVKPGGPHDGFVAVDPEGYLLEFETFFQHPENEILIPELTKLNPQSTALGEKLRIQASVAWLYYTDMLPAQEFVEQQLGLSLSADQGWAKVYRLSTNSYLGLVDGLRGMNSFSPEKLVEINVNLENPDLWENYLKANSRDSTRQASSLKDAGGYLFKF
jgi:catechol 2,3-dioxygenase-like lactoylglutathione lyase family enzyme